MKLREIAVFPVTRGPVVLQLPVLTRTSLFTGKGGEFFTCLDKRSGRQIWRKRKIGHIKSAHGDSVLAYVGNTKETQLWNEDGKVVWKRPGMWAAQGERVFSNENGRLHVIDVMTGKTVDEFDCLPGVPSLMHDGVLLQRPVDRNSDPIQAVDLVRRTVAWQRHLIPEIRERYQDDCSWGLAFMASHPGQVVAKSRQHLVGVSLADGSLRWGRALSLPYVAPRVRDGRLYVWSASAGSTSTRVTLDLDSGQMTRERSVPATSDNRLVIVEEATGAILIDRPLAPYGAAFQRVHEGRAGVLCRHHVVFTTFSGLIAVFRLSDAELVWQYEHSDELFDPVFDDNRLYVTCANGTIVVFEAEGGEL